MKKFYFLILGIVLCGMVAQAQNSYEGHIGFGQHHVVRSRYEFLWAGRLHRKNSWKLHAIGWED